MSMLGRMFGFGRNEHYDRGIRFFDQGLYPEAITALQKVSQQNAGDSSPDEVTERLALFYIAEAHAHLGAAAMEGQRYDEARSAFEAALAINPHYADLHFQSGRAARCDGDLPGAMAAFDAALAINPRYAKALFYRGLSLYAASQPDAGFASVQNAVAADPAFGVPPFADAVAAHESGDPAAALFLLGRIADTDVDDIAFHSGLGADLYRRGMYAESVREFEKALALNPNYADLRNSLGIALSAQELHPEAVAEFRRALALNPHYTEARTNLALTLRAAGQTQEADAEFARVRQNEPGNAVIRGELGC